MTTALERMVATTQAHPDRAYFECPCGFTMVDGSVDQDGFSEDVWEHQETCPGDVEPVVRPIDEPLEWCARCGSADVAELRASDGPAVAVKCGPCGHVLSLVALRGLADRMGEASPELIVYQLQFLAGHRRDYVLVSLDINLDAFNRVFGGESA